MDPISPLLVPFVLLQQNVVAWLAALLSPEENGERQKISCGLLSVSLSRLEGENPPLPGAAPPIITAHGF